jgi:hypothetical protein
MKKITLFMLIVFTITSQGQNKLLSKVQQYYDNNNNVWFDNTGSNYEYDGNNNLISETTLNFAQSQAWKNVGKTIYTYNASNKVTVQIDQNWNATNNTFENSYKTLKTYTNGNRTESIFQTWNTSSSTWVNTEKQDLTFNSNNKPDGGLFYTWDGTQWVQSVRFTVTYNANNKVTSILAEKWDDFNGIWTNSGKEVVTYNLNNNITSDKSASWVSGSWKLTEQTDYIVDANGNPTSETYTNVTDNTKNSKTETIYDTTSLMSSFANPFKDTDGTSYLTHDPYVNKALSYSEFYYNTSTSTYVKNRITTYNYNTSIVLANEKYEIAKATISVFPNPTKDVLTIQNTSNNTIDKVIVTDISGKIILQQNQNTNQVDVQNLAKGMYILQAFSGKEKFTSKFVKE